MVFLDFKKDVLEQRVKKIIKDEVSRKSFPNCFLLCTKGFTIFPLFCFVFSLFFDDFLFLPILSAFTVPNRKCSLRESSLRRFVDSVSCALTYLKLNKSI